MRLHPELDDVCFVEVGDFTGIALRRAAAAGVEPRRVRRDGGQDHQARRGRDDDPLPPLEGRRRAARGGRPRSRRAGRRRGRRHRDRDRPPLLRGVRRARLARAAQRGCASRRPRRAGSTSTARSRSRSSWSTSTARRWWLVPERIAVVGVIGGEPVGKEARAAVDAATVVAGGTPPPPARSPRSVPAPCRSAGPLTDVLDAIAARARRRLRPRLRRPRVLRDRARARRALRPRAPRRPPRAVVGRRSRSPAWACRGTTPSVISAHGRPLADAARRAVRHPKAAVLVAPDAPPEALGRELRALGAPHRRAAVCARLGNPTNASTSSPSSSSPPAPSTRCRSSSSSTATGWRTRRRSSGGAPSSASRPGTGW